MIFPFVKYAPILVLLIAFMPLAMADEIGTHITPASDICWGAIGGEDGGTTEALSTGGVVQGSLSSENGQGNTIESQNAGIYTFWCGTDGYGGMNRTLNSPVIGLPLFMPLGAGLIVFGMMYKGAVRGDLSPEGFFAAAAGFIVLLIYIPCYL